MPFGGCLERDIICSYFVSVGITRSSLLSSNSANLVVHSIGVTCSRKVGIRIPASSIAEGRGDISNGGRMLADESIQPGA